MNPYYKCYTGYRYTVKKKKTNKQDKSEFKRVCLCVRAYVSAAFTCALQKEVLYHGKLYISENNVCFFSSVLLKETKVSAVVKAFWKIR